MRNVKALNIDNTFRSANINTQLALSKISKFSLSEILAEDINLDLAKDMLNEQQEQDKLERSDKNLAFERSYDSSLSLNKFVVVDDSDNLEDIITAIKLGYNIKYFSTKPFPEKLIVASHGHKNIILYYRYQYQEIPLDVLRSIKMASQLCRVAIEIPVKLGIGRTLDVKSDLYDVKFLLEKVVLRFINVSPDEYEKLGNTFQVQYLKEDDYYTPTTQSRLVYYNKLHEPLARWKMQLFIEVNNAYQSTELEKMALDISK